MEDGYSINDYLEIQINYDQSPFSVTTSTFDSQQELLWVGNNDGRVTSYYGLEFSKYTSFKVQNQVPILAINAQRNRDALYFLQSDMLSSYTRFGVNIFKHKETSLKNLQCMFFNQQERFYLGGFTDNIFDFDIERKRILRQLQIDEKDCILIKYSDQNLVCTGSTNGQINLRDPFTLKSIHTFYPHTASLSDFDVHGNYLTTCGFSMRMGSLCVDRFLMIYDLRAMRVMNPIQLLIEPAFIHYLPIYPGVAMVATQSGCFQMIDTNISNVYYQLYQAQIPPVGLCNSFSISDNCQAVAFGHETGSVHLFSKGDTTQFNDYSLPTTFADPIIPLNYMDINDKTQSFSNIPMPFTDELLISSNLPKDWSTYQYRPTPSIDEELLSNARVIHGITSAPNRINMKRNQVNDAYKKCISKLGELSHKTIDNTNQSDDQEKKQENGHPETNGTKSTANEDKEKEVKN